MIRAFKSRALKKFFETGNASRLSVPNIARVERLLTSLNSAASPQAMNLPGYGFHALKGNRSGTYAVSASGNWRLTFKWDGQDAIDVDLEDYH